jgi:hypothetical protein
MALQPFPAITLPILYGTLCRRKCDLCGKAAQYIWLPSCTRACLQCPSKHPEYDSPGLSPLEEEAMVEVYGLDELTLRRVPCWQFPPITFIQGTQRIQVKDWHTLYDSEAVQAWCLKSTSHPVMQGERPIMEQKARESGSFRRTIRRANALEVSPQTFVAAQPPDDLYTMATVIARWLIPNEAPTMGLYCATCQFTEEQYRMYTSDSLKTHLSGCRVQPHDIRALRARAYYKELFLQLSKEIGKSQSTVQKFCPSRLYQRSI